MDYTTVDALRAFGSFESSEEDPMLAALITSASRIVDRATRRIFAVEEETVRTFRKSIRYENNFDGQILYLDEDLAEEASIITDTPTVTYIPENVPPYFAICLEEGSWAAVVEVTGYWGFSRTPPADIEYATMRIAKWLYELRDTSRTDYRHYSVLVTPEGQLLIPTGMPPDIDAILKPFKRIVIGR